MGLRCMGRMHHNPSLRPKAVSSMTHLAPTRIRSHHFRNPDHSSHSGQEEEEKEYLSHHPSKSWYSFRVLGSGLMLFQFRSTGDLRLWRHDERGNQWTKGGKGKAAFRYGRHFVLQEKDLTGRPSGSVAARSSWPSF